MSCLSMLSVLLLQAETEQKENFAAALAANRKALDESRQDRGSLRYEMDAKNRKAEALATELHLTETSLSERQAEVALLKGHERDYLQKIALLEVHVTPWLLHVAMCKSTRASMLYSIHRGWMLHQKPLKLNGVEPVLQGPCMPSFHHNQIGVTGRSTQLRYVPAKVAHSVGLGACL